MGRPSLHGRKHMNARWMAVAALLTVVAGCASPGRGPADANGGAVKAKEKVYTDAEGRKVVVRFDELNKVTVHATDREGKPLEVTEFPLAQAQLCLSNAGKQHCLPVASLPEGTVIQLGSAPAPAPEGAVKAMSLTTTTPTPCAYCWFLFNVLKCTPPGCTP
jgi:hypothetical protein